MIRIARVPTNPISVLAGAGLPAIDAAPATSARKASRASPLLQLVQMPNTARVGANLFAKASEARPYKNRRTPRIESHALPNPTPPVGAGLPAIDAAHAITARKASRASLLPQHMYPLTTH